ncbi:MAG: SpoVR family protein, partial [Deltaproteobacteria bacterium]|nr:SpoVR family protein [Deltaproteobacteria bacterium]
LNYNQMIGFMAYGGLPSRYSHWSFGKAFEKTKMLYSYGITGLPYEMVINSDPCLAYLMKDNSLCLQILTMAHVFGHNNFFKTNFYFQHSPVKASEALMMFKNHARQIQKFYEDPTLDIEDIETTIDHAHVLRFHTPSNFLQKASEEDEKNLFGYDLRESILGFLAKHSRNLTPWQRYILEVVEKESFYFMPQIETKIINEGWASFIHYVIMHQLSLPQNLHFEFLINHSQVLRPIFGGINPYHVGFEILKNLFCKEDEFDPLLIKATDTNFKYIKEVIKTERDSSFLRRFLTPELAERLYLFEHSKKGKHRIVSRLPTEDNFEVFREHLIKQTGSLSIPKLKVKDVIISKNCLVIEHIFDGRELQLEWSEQALKSISWLWGGECILETKLNGKNIALRCLNNEVKIDKLAS